MRGFFLVLCYLLSVFGRFNDEAAAQQINVLALGQFSQLTSRGLEWFTGRTKTLSAVFPLAIKHFNERNGMIIPKFANNTCNVSLNLVEYVDDENSATQAMKRLVARQATGSVDVILGPVTSAVAGPIAVAASALGVPVLSHWATSAELSVKRNYEYFSRTVPSDDALSMLMADLLVRMGFKKAGLVYINNNFGQSWKNSLANFCEINGVHLLQMPFDDTVGLTLDRCKSLGQSFENILTLYPAWFLSDQ
jgi:Receptor family ligand binding region